MKKGISQEGLKLIACLTMLIDHIGVTVLLTLYRNAGELDRESIYHWYLLSRVIGRLALPIYAFLLTEGVRHTHSKGKYALRLLTGAVLAELPFDLVVSGGVDWRSQSIMVTLLLGFGALAAMEKSRSLTLKPLLAAPFAIAAELLGTDYGWMGVVLVMLFELSHHMYGRSFVRLCGMLVLFHFSGGMVLSLGNLSVPLQALGALSMVFISRYDGRKLTASPWAKWGFYLFYPVHLLVLWLVSGMLVVGTTL